MTSTIVCGSAAAASRVHAALLLIFPADHLDQVRHEGGDLALEQRAVAQDHVGVVHLLDVVLAHHWKAKVGAKLERRIRQVIESLKASRCYTLCSGRPFTKGLVMKVLVAVAVSPALHGDKVADVAGDLALDQRRVSQDDVGVLGLGGERLRDH